MRRVRSFVITLLVFALFLSACAAPAAAPAAEQEAEAPPAPVEEQVPTVPAGSEQIPTTESPTSSEPASEPVHPPAQSEPAAAPGEATVQLTFLSMYSSEADRAFQEEQIQAFMAQHPDIHVDVELVPWNEFEMRLAAMLAAGMVDVVATRAHLAWSLAYDKWLQPIPDGAVAFEDFRPDALANVRLPNRGDEYVGVPWRRSRDCSPYYWALGLTAATSEAEAALDLIRFLSSAEVQEAGYAATEGSWLPTRRDVYETLGISCPERGVVVRLPPELQQRAVAVAEERVGELQDVLEGNNEITSPFLEKPQSFAVERTTGFAATQEFVELQPLNEEEAQLQLLAALTPVRVDYTQEAFMEALQMDEGVIVGAIFGVDDAMHLIFDEGEVWIEPGQTVAVKWRLLDDTHVAVFLVGPDGGEEEVGIARLEEMRTGEGATGTPSVTVEVVNPCRIYYKIDDKDSSVRVADTLVAGTNWVLSQTGATILYYSHECGD